MNRAGVRAGGVLAVAMAALLSACSGGPPPPAGTASPALPGQGGGASDASAQINGAGATFPYPIYSKWFSEYGKLHPDVRINYQSIGSGGGIRQLTEQTVFFGATDGPMTDAQLKSAPGALVQLALRNRSFFFLPAN